jgi:wyosine [tRNA(Phe)-imidazoG37] synthetase (radical SAM superfamily)
VGRDCAKADVVLPSLDACDEETFVKINRPHESISVGRLIDGLCAFRAGYAGQIWLEVFLVPGVNTDIGQIAGIKRLVERIRPDKIHLNTAVRPAAEPGVKRLDEEGLRDIAARLGPTCEVIADFSPPRRIEALGKGAADVFSMLRRRPCSLEDVSSGLGIGRQEAAEYIGLLRRRGLVTSEKKNGATFFRAG